MKKILFFNAFAVLALLFTSCGPTTSILSMHDDYANIYIGKSYQEILLALGAPDRETSDGANGSVLIYEDETTLTTTKATKENYNQYSGTYVPGARSSSTTITSFLHLFVNADKICYNLKTNHTKAVSLERLSIKEKCILMNNEFRQTLSPSELTEFDNAPYILGSRIKIIKQKELMHKYTEFQKTFYPPKYR